MRLINSHLMVIKIRSRGSLVCVYMDVLFPTQAISFNLRFNGVLPILLRKSFISSYPSRCFTIIMLSLQCLVVALASIIPALAVPGLPVLPNLPAASTTPSPSPSPVNDEPAASTSTPPSQSTSSANVTSTHPGLACFVNGNSPLCLPPGVFALNNTIYDFNLAAATTLTLPDGGKVTINAGGQMTVFSSPSAVASDTFASVLTTILGSPGATIKVEAPVDPPGVCIFSAPQYGGAVKCIFDPFSVRQTLPPAVQNTAMSLTMHGGANMWAWFLDDKGLVIANPPVVGDVPELSAIKFTPYHYTAEPTPAPVPLANNLVLIQLQYGGAQNFSGLTTLP